MTSAWGGGTSPTTRRKESGTMLVLGRKLNEAVLIDGDIRITVVGIRGNQVRLGIEAPDRVKVFREELCAGAERAGEIAGHSAAAPRTGGDDGGPAPGRPTSPAR